jgi:hypothetical protein
MLRSIVQNRKQFSPMIWAVEAAVDPENQVVLEPNERTTKPLAKSARAWEPIMATLSQV